MADPIPVDFIPLAMIIGIFTIFMIIVTILAALRHREKRTQVTKTLLVMYVLFIVANGIGLVTAIFGILGIPAIRFVSEISAFLGDRLVLVLINTFFAQFELVFFLVGFYFMFVFAQLVFGDAN